MMEDANGEVKTSLMHVDRDSGQMSAIGTLDASREGLVPMDLDPATYQGFAMEAVPDSAAAILTAAVQDDEIDILPTGELYMGHSRYRQRLTQAFGPMAWGMRPLGGHQYDSTEGTLYREWGLFVRGRLAAIAVGSADYHETNDRMSYADAAEAVKSNALSRCCKDLGICMELWDRRWAERFRREHCVKVWRDKARKGQGGYEWRRKDADPFYDEKVQAMPDKAKPQTAAAAPSQAQATTSQAPAGQTSAPSTAVPTAQPAAQARPAAQAAAQPVATPAETTYPANLVTSAEFIKGSSPDAARAWKLYAVRLENVQVNFETLDDAIFEYAKAQMDAQVPVIVIAKTKTDQRGKVHHDIVRIAAAF